MPQSPNAAPHRAMSARPGDLMQTAECHARDWAEGKTKEEILAEADRALAKAQTHRYDWQEVGSAAWDYTRADVLRSIAARMDKAHGGA